MNLDEYKQQTPPERPESDYTTCNICNEICLKEDIKVISIGHPFIETGTEACYACQKELDL